MPRNMGNVWLKIKVWTKITIFALLSIAILVFLFQNVNKPVTVWFWNDIPTTLLKVLIFTALFSVILTLLVGTTFKTVRQFKEMRHRSRTEKLESDIAEMRQKAAMLQTKPASTAGSSPAEIPVDRD